MKKIYALAAAALAAVSMNAQTLYLVGSGQVAPETYLGWAPETPYEVNLENGCYTFDIAGLEGFKMSTTFGSWDEFNAGALWANITRDAVNNATPVELEANSGPNISGPWAGDYHFVVSGDLTTIVATTTTPDPGGYTEVYVRGEVSSWGNDIADMWKMSTEDGVTYTFKAEGETKIPAGLAFKLADLTWNKVNYSYGLEKDELLEADGEELEWYWNCKNTMFTEDFEGTITMVLPEEFMAPATVACTPAAGVSSVAVDANAPAEFFNLQGVRVANPENGLFIVRQGGKVSKIVR